MATGVITRRIAKHAFAINMAQSSVHIHFTFGYLHNALRERLSVPIINWIQRLVEESDVTQLLIHTDLRIVESISRLLRDDLLNSVFRVSLHDVANREHVCFHVFDRRLYDVKAARLV